MPTWSVRIGLYVGLMFTLAAAGCGQSGPEIAPVSGRVTLDGQPVFEAEVLFQPDDMKSPSYGFTDKEGRYELGYKRGVKGALIGWHTISIQMDTEVLGQNGKLMRRPQLIPRRYYEQSELRREVKSGEENEFDFALTSDGK
jgi:hypothetical protein